MLRVQKKVKHIDCIPHNCVDSFQGHWNWNLARPIVLRMDIIGTLLGAQGIRRRMTGLEAQQRGVDHGNGDFILHRGGCRCARESILSVYGFGGFFIGKQASRSKILELDVDTLPVGEISFSRS